MGDTQRDDLAGSTEVDLPADHHWYLAYTKSRQEKSLLRKLRESDIWHYAPQIPRRYRSPQGRIRTSIVPLFANYVFVYADEMGRYKTVSTGCVMKMATIDDSQTLVADLRQIRSLIAIDVPMTVEGRVGPGQRVRVRNGSFAGYEGIVDRRDAETRLIVAVQFMDQGVSVKLDDCQLEVL